MQAAQHQETLIQYADTEEVLVEDVCLVTAEEDEALVETTIYARQSALEWTHQYHNHIN